VGGGGGGVGGGVVQNELNGIADAGATRVNLLKKLRFCGWVYQPSRRR